MLHFTVDLIFIRSNHTWETLPEANFDNPKKERNYKPKNRMERNHLDKEEQKQNYL